MGFWIGSQDGMLEEIRGLKKQIAELSGDKEGLAKARKYAGEIITLREEISGLKIDRSKIEEEQARKEREVRHEVGLLRKQVETETKLERDKAILEVREENLQADRDRFEEQMKFTTARFEKEVEYLHKTIGKVLERLPNVTEHIALGGTNGRRPTGKKTALVDD